MTAPLHDGLREAFGSGDAEAAKTLLAQAADQLAVLRTAGNAKALASLADELAAVYGEVGEAELSVELCEQRGFLCALVRMARPEAKGPVPSPQRRYTTRTLARRRAHDRVRVAVLSGGVSSEREESLRSGAAVCGALRGAAYQVQDIDVREMALGDLSPRRVDVAFVALRGTYGEDGGVQQALETMGVPYTGSGVEASRRAADKIAAKKLFRGAGVTTPAFVEVEAEWAEPLKLRAARSLGFPVVLKPACEGSSFGVTLANSADELAAALHEPFQYDTRALVEQYVGGRELTVGILDERPLPMVELAYDAPLLTYDVRHAAGAVRRVVHPELAPEVAATVQSTALAAHRSLGCRGCTRVDVRLRSDGVPCVLEVNTLPLIAPDGLVAEAAGAAGLSFPELCEHLLELATSDGSAA